MSLNSGTTKKISGREGAISFLLRNQKVKQIYLEEQVSTVSSFKEYVSFVLLSFRI